MSWRQTCVQAEPSDEDEEDTVADESSPSRTPSRAQCRHTPSYSALLGMALPRESVVHTVDARTEVALAKLVQGPDLLFA